MVDYHSRYRMYGLGYNYTNPRQTTPSYRDIYREHAPLVFRPRNPLGHDCREEVMKEHTDSRLWETHILAHGLNKTYEANDILHYKERHEPGTKSEPDKMLYVVGDRGKAPGNFNYPRGMAINSEGEVFIADAQNHRIQIFNCCGVLKTHFGSKGKGEEEFMEPCGVGILPNDDIVVAEKMNRRLNVLTSSGKHKFFIEMQDEPFCVACDAFYNIAVSTYKGEVALYRRGGKFVNKFSVTKIEEPEDSQMAMYIAVNNKGEIVVSDSNENFIKFFNHQGELLYKFQPVATHEGLGVGNSGICINPLDQLIVADGLNHVVNVYTERGVLLQQLYAPIDDVGPIQACALGPEGHFFCTEFTGNGRHCLKIFRYRDCDCHRNRPPSSKRSSRSGTPAKMSPWSFTEEMKDLDVRLTPTSSTK